MEMRKNVQNLYTSFVRIWGLKATCILRWIWKVLQIIPTIIPAEIWKKGTDSLPSATVGCVIGAHAGPGAIAVAFFEACNS